MRGTKAKRLRKAGLKSGPVPRVEGAPTLSPCAQCGRSRLLNAKRLCARCDG